VLTNSKPTDGVSLCAGREFSQRKVSRGRERSVKKTTNANGGKRSVVEGWGKKKHNDLRKSHHGVNRDLIKRLQTSREKALST